MKACAWLSLLVVTLPLGAGESRPIGKPQYLGAGSCAAAACHNAPALHGQSFTEYAFWVTRDPHARAYEVLFNDRSLSMQRNLGSKLAPHKDQRCLGCHAGPEYVDAKPPERAPHFKTDGVSCESCHGPASQWIGEHHLDGWTILPAREKARRGMNDTRSLLGRAQVCATCHIGAAGMDVNHDLIAAGHPRLLFEFTAYHEHLPRHWPDAKDRANVVDFQAKLWIAGQLASTHAALDLLADRAGVKERPWPEFAEFDCRTCHHDLKSPSGRPLARKGLNALRWGSLTFAVDTLPLVTPDASALHDALRTLRKRMDTPASARTLVAADAAKAARLLRERFALPNLDASKLRQALLKARHDGDDETTHWQLALLALTAGERDFSTKTLGKLRLQSYDPQAVHQRLIDLK